METVLILGAGDLGATLASRLAAREAAGHVVLVDSEGDRAEGKALDIRESGPIEGSDAVVLGRREIGDLPPPDAVVIADPPELRPELLTPRSAAEFVKPLVPLLARGAMLVGRGSLAPLLGAALRLGLPRDRVLGTWPLAWSGAARRFLSSELGVEASAVSLSVLGLPPENLVLSLATVSGVAVDLLSPTALRRAREALRRRDPGPFALAAAAAGILRALFSPRTSVLPVAVALDGEFSHRRVILGVPGKIGIGRLQSVVEFPLDPVDRVALDSAAQRALAQGACR